MYNQRMTWMVTIEVISSIYEFVFGVGTGAVVEDRVQKTKVK
jgi:hypothetical protein